MRFVVPSALIVAGIMHLPPLVGVLGGARLAALYGLSIDDPNIAILLRHRAVLFGLLALFLLSAAFKPALHAAALAAGLISVAAFLWLALSAGGYNEELRRVVAADLLALMALAIGGAVHLRTLLTA